LLAGYSVIIGVLRGLMERFAAGADLIASAWSDAEPTPSIGQRDSCHIRDEGDLLSLVQLHGIGVEGLTFSTRFSTA
jgi:hypothetical protein